ncbi:hypothetical protein BV20DRAFT_966971 [Pilatotrama ljubarskyi]|nr:hypothetical protein BV20DRAFT_966971 [Pilatotrama ljubarskyi]
MKACTAFVTEIAYARGNGLEAEVEFLSKEEWEEEVRLLIGDLNHPKNHEADDVVAAARAKIEAVYPSFTVDDLSRMTPEQLIMSNSMLPLCLGNSTRVIAKDSTQLSLELSRYLGHEPDASPSDLPDTAGSHTAPPAYWPLVRHVRIYVDSPILACGAVLVDLPGVGDSNAARNLIAQGYMRRANRFFIVAPITRAVNDKVAIDLCGQAFRTQLKMDGKYHSGAITFVATKCDDVDCKEVIAELSLRKSTELHSIEKCIKDARSNLNGWQKTEKQLLKSQEDLETRLQTTGSTVAALSAQRQSIQAECDEEVEAVMEGKMARKRAHESGAAATASHLSKKPRHLSGHATLGALSEDGATSGEREELRNQLIEVSRRLTDFRHLIEKATNDMQNAENERLVFCVTKRSEWSKGKLKSQFRAGLAEMEAADDDVASGDRMSPDQGEADLAVFAVAARTYLQLRADEDGTKSAFKSSDTGIPELRRWIQTLTLPAREEAAEAMLLQLQDFARNVEKWLDGIPGVSLADREQLKARWRSKQSPLGEQGETPLGRHLAARYPTTPDAILPKLLEAFQPVVDKLVGGLSNRFAKELPERCRLSANASAEEVIEASDAFVTARAMRYQTYSATLRRKGVFRYDLNAELAVPFTKRIARAWADIFKAKSLLSLEKRASTQVRLVLDEVVASAPPYLQKKAREEADETARQARRALRRVETSVQEALDALKMDIGLSLSPTVQGHLADGYELAAMEKGTGSFRRQRDVFNAYLETKKSTLFNDTTVALEKHLGGASKVVSEALDRALHSVASGVEVRIAILWEGCPLEGEEDNKARVSTKTMLRETIDEVDRWLKARSSGMTTVLPLRSSSAAR